MATIGLAEDTGSPSAVRRLFEWLADLLGNSRFEAGALNVRVSIVRRFHKLVDRAFRDRIFAAQ